jgi:hypothetical protein
LCKTGETPADAGQRLDRAGLDQPGPPARQPDHPSLVLNETIGALAHLALGRAYAHAALQAVQSRSGPLAFRPLRRQGQQQGRPDYLVRTTVLEFTPSETPVLRLGREARH